MRFYHKIVLLLACLWLSPVAVWAQPAADFFNAHIGETYAALVKLRGQPVTTEKNGPDEGVTLVYTGVYQNRNYDILYFIYNNKVTGAHFMDKDFDNAPALNYGNDTAFKAQTGINVYELIENNGPPQTYMNIHAAGSPLYKILGAETELLTYGNATLYGHRPVEITYYFSEHICQGLIALSFKSAEYEDLPRIFHTGESALTAQFAQSAWLRYQRELADDANASKLWRANKYVADTDYLAYWAVRGRPNHTGFVFLLHFWRLNPRGAAAKREVRQLTGHFYEFIEMEGWTTGGNLNLRPPQNPQPE